MSFLNGPGWMPCIGPERFRLPRNTDSGGSQQHKGNLKWLPITFYWLLFTGYLSLAQVNKAEYFFDSDPGLGSGFSLSMAAGDSVSISPSIPVSTLSAGFHVLYVRTRMAGRWSQTESRTFFKLTTTASVSRKIKRFEYFFDTDPGNGSGIQLSGFTAGDSVEVSRTVSISSLSTGFHTLYIRSLDETNVWSTTETRPFYITPSVTATAGPISRLEYFYDTDPGAGLGTQVLISPSTDSSEKTTVIPIASLSAGFHTIYVRAKNNRGWSMAESRTFFVTTSASLTAGPINQLEYFFDTDPGVGLATKININPTADSSEKTSVIPISSLSAGFHTIYVRAKNNKGWSMAESRTFFITTSTSLTAGPINQLEYFFDTDPGVGLATKININPAADSSEKTSVIPISSLSAGFHTIYVRAKNNKGWSISETRSFYIYPASSITSGPVAKMEYFIDTDPGVGLGTAISAFTAGDSVNVSRVLVVPSSLTVGVHRLYIRSQTSDKRWAIAEENDFTVDCAEISIAATQTQICSGASTTLSFASGNQPGTYQWYRNSVLIPGATSFSHTTTQTGGYTLRYSFGTCLDTSDVLAIGVGTAVTATATASGSTNICAGSTVNINANSGTGLSYQWLLNNNIITGQTGIQLANVAASGSYSVIVTNATGCKDTSNIMAVVVTPLPPKPSISAGGPTTFCDGGSVVLTTTAASGRWSTGETTQSITVSSSAVIRDTAIVNGCKIVSDPFTTTENNCNDLPGSGNAISFDGVNDEILIPNSNHFLEPASFTFECWVKKNNLTSSTTNDRLIVSQDNNGYGIAFNPDGSLFLSLVGVSGVNSTSKVLDLKWHHVAVSHNGATAQFYIDGINAGSVAYPVTFSSSSVYSLGNRHNRTEFLNGTMDEVRLWNVVLTQTQIRDRMCRKVLGSDGQFGNLLAYFNFDETTGTSAFNAAGPDVDGTLTNGPTRVTSGAPIGDEAVTQYQTSGFPTLTFTNGSQETFAATFTGGTLASETGAAVYIVREKPNSETGISGVGTNDRYYGVFSTGITNPQYTAIYNYGTNPFVTVGNENSLALFKRTDNSVSTWANAFATRNTTANTLTITGQSTEYMIGVGAGGEVNPGTIGSDQTISCSNLAPALLTSVADATTTTGFAITYQWQDSTKGGSWQNIASATASTFQPPLLSDSIWYRRKASASTFSALSNEVAILIQGVVAGDPTVYGNNTWNLYAWNGTDINLGTSLVYKGFYTVGGLAVNTQNDWGANASPSSSSIWQGCAVQVDNFTWTLRRKGFPVGNYIMNVPSNDDQINVLVNGTSVYTGNCCGGATNITLGTLGASDSVDVRMVEFGGGANVAFNIVTSALQAGSIGSSQLVCGGGAPSAFTSTQNAFGGPTINITYQWQDSTKGGSWANVALATSAGFQAGSLTDTAWYRRIAKGGAQTAISNIIEVQVAFVTGDASIFPSNTWNLYAYTGTDLALGSGNVYKGFYSVNALNVSTQDQWNANASPSSASGYQGCPVPVDNFTFVLKRRGFPAGPYTLNIPSHDDGVQVYVNGTLLFEHISCCDAHTGIDLGTLGANSTVEVRTVEGGGSANVSIQFIAATFQGGIIAADQNVCSGTAPLALTNVQDASGGGIGTISYQWQDSTVSGSWQNISLATNPNYQPALLSVTTWFRRKATGGTTIAFSNEVQISVVAAPTVLVAPVGPINFCSGGSQVLTGTFSTGSTRQWLRNGAVLSGQTATTLTATLSGTYKAVAFNGSCTDTSNAVVINVNPKPAPIVTPGGPLTLCQGSTIDLDWANPVGAQTIQWKKNGLPVSGGNTLPVSTAGSYYIVATFTATGCKDSSNVVVINLVSPQVTPIGPVNICSGSNSTLTVANIGTASLQWFRNNSPISGETNATLSITQAGTYRVDASVGITCTVSSNDVVAQVVTPPLAEITPPSTTSFCQGGNLVLEANTGTGLTYQWKLNGGNIGGATNPTLSASSAGDYSVAVTNSGPCTTVSSAVSLTALSNIAWFIDADADGYGTGTTVSNCFRPANGFLGSELIATAGDCNDNDATINPGRQFFTFSGAQGFASALTSPLTGTSYTNFRFEVTYTDLNNNPPPATFPRVILDYEGNGQLNNANDRTILMTQVDNKDVTTNDGKKYFATVNSLPSGQQYTTRILTSIGNCATTIGPFDYPDVFILSDLQIFANDITFDNTNPDVSSPLVVSAVIHNVSDFSAQNFVVHLVNQYNPLIVYPDIVVPNLAPHSDQTVTWNITTPAEAAWCPMQVDIDFTNIIEETNELDNSAIRPFVNGPFNVPGEITVSPSVSPSTVVGVSGASVTLIGVANYSGTAVPLQDPSVAGAQVTFTITPGGQTYTTYTNSSGQINFSFYVPLTPGTYTITGTITDFTLTTNFTTTFVVVPPVCLVDLTASVSVSSTHIVEGESITGNIRVTNSGCQPTTDSTLLSISQSGGLPIKVSVKVPALAVNAFYDVPIPAITFDDPGTYSICGTADGAFEVTEQSEGNNSDCEIITVIPFLPDIYPVGCGVGGSVYLSSQTYTHTFSFYNSGGSATGPFTVRIQRFKDGNLIGTFDRPVADLARESYGSVSIDVTYDEIGTYTYSMACDIPVPPGVVTETNENNNTSGCQIIILAPQTDLAINGCENFDVDPVDPAFPGNITLKARVVNQGNLTATAPILVRFTRTSGTTDDVLINNDLAPGQSVLVTKQVAASAPGTDTASVMVDPLNAFNEFNESNNSRTNMLCHESAPVDNYCGGNWWNGTYLINQAIFLNVPVTVSGLYNISQLKVRFFVSGPGLNGTLNLGDATLDNISETCGCPFVATLPVNFAFPAEGIYTFTFVTDPDNLYTECIETNNTLVRTVKVSGLPDMRMLSQGINPSLLNPDVGEPITIDANYENIGLANIDQTMKVKLLVDEIAVDSQTVNGLVNGDNFTVNFATPWSSTLVGAHIIRTIIDADNVVDENNETNNEATRAVIVGAAANLYFQVFQPSNSSPALGNNITIQARIGNAGDVPVDGVVQFFYINNQNDTVQIGQLGLSLIEHDSVTLNLPWTVADNNTILIGKIVNATVMEFNYEDNMATAPIGGFAVSTTSTPSCAGKPNGTLTANPSGGTAPFTVTWSTGFIGPVLTSGPGLYSGTVTDANSVSVNFQGSIPNIVGTKYYEDADGDGHGNPAVDSIDCTKPVGYVLDSIDCNDGNIAVYKKTGKPVISHNGNLIFCSGGSVTLSVPPSNFINYKWSTSETSTSIVVSTAGSVTVEASQDSGCSATSNPIITQVITNLVPTAGMTVSPDSNVCTGTQVTFTAIVSGGGTNPTLEWLVNSIVVVTGGNTFSSNSLNDNDVVQVRYTSSETCASPAVVLSNTISMSIGNTLTANAGSDQTVCANTTTLAATGSGTWTLLTGNGNFADSENPTSAVTGLSSGLNEFIWTVSSGNCPTASDTVQITVIAPPSAANAGTDQTLCSGETSLNGNPPAVGTGTWTLISGSGDLSNAGLFNSNVTNLGVGQSVFVWSIANGSCPASTDTVKIIRQDVPTPANAGADQSLCANQTNLEGNPPTVGNGAWTLLSGSGTITDPSLFNSAVTGLGSGENRFIWTISNGVCPSVSDTVSISINLFPSTANAGQDQALCNDATSLEGNQPTSGTGTWSLTSGSGNLADALAFNSSVTNLGVGDNVFVWSVAIGNCPASTDTVVVTRQALPTPSDAGQDQTLCGGQTNLAGNAPTAGTGQWTLVSGSGILADAANPVNSVSGLGSGENKFAWTITNGICPESSDTVSIFITPAPTPADAGQDQTVCGSATVLSGNTPQSGTGTWSVLSGTGTFSNVNQPDASLTDLTPGLNTFIWSLSVGNCPASTDTVNIISQNPPDLAEAGQDQTLCTDHTVTTAPSEFNGSGLWTLVSGSGDIANTNQAHTLISNLGTGENKFAWTLSNGVCPSNSDTVSLTVNPFPTTADAGQDQTICDTTVVLQGNESTAGTGTWSTLSGSGTFNSLNQPNATVNGLSVGENVFVWSIAFGSCPASTDTVTISRLAPPTAANAGPDQVICQSTQATLAGNVPAIGSGLWTLISGVGTITNSDLANSGVTGLETGDNLFVWTITNGVCPSVSDTVSITLAAPIDVQLDADATICEDWFSIHPSPSTGGVWTILAGTGSMKGNSLFTSIGLNTVSYTVTGPGGCTYSDTINIIRVDSSQAANAGPDQILCSQTTSTLAANAATSGVGSWTVISGTAVVTNPSDPNSAVTGLSLGDHILRWTITNAPCPDHFDDVTLTVTSILVADAGKDSTICGDSILLQGNGQGQWTVVSGSGTFVSPGLSATMVQNLGPGTNVFQWKLISNGCPSDSDEVAITITPPASTALAGTDQSLCTDSTHLAGNVPAIGTGTWTLVSGTGLITSASDPTTLVTGLSIGENKFLWTIANGTCTGNSDTVSIVVNPPPTPANAGADQTICDDSTKLAANQAFSATAWSIVSGSGTFSDVDQNDASITGLAVGQNILVWSISNGACPPSTDTVVITRQAAPDLAQANVDQTVCADTAVLSGNIPVVGSGIWTLVSGSGSLTDPNLAGTVVSGLSEGENKFAWTISNGICPPTSDTVTLTVIPAPTVADAGANQVVCINAVTLAANAPVVGTGTWTQIFGTGTIGDTQNPGTSVDNLSIGTNLFVWTISNASCTPSTDTVLIAVSQPIGLVNAGNDTAVCGSSVTLNAQLPVLGLWSSVSGTVQFQNPVDPHTLASGLQSGVNQLIWTSGLAPCPTKSDTVNIVSNPSVAANAGASFIACGDTASLNAVPPGFGTGIWTVDQGSAILANPGANNSHVSNLGIGLNVFRWTISVTTCPDVSDTMVIERLANPVFLGNDTTICTDSLLTLDAGAGFQSYLWQDASSQQTFVVDTAGTYFVDVTTAANCNFRDSIVVTEAICTDVDPLLNAQIRWSVFPNPSKGNFEIQVFNSRTPSSRIRMYNGLGVQVFDDRITPASTDWNYSVKTRHLPNGVYYLEVEMGQQKLKTKVVLVD